jgi:MFS family permease
MLTKIQAKKNLKLLFWTNLIAGSSFIAPVATLYQQFNGLSILDIIIVYNVCTLFIWLLEIPASVIADTMGRKLSLTLSTVAKIINLSIFLLYPTFIGFLFASFFSALVGSFLSGTFHAFLEENLRKLNKQKQYGKYIGNYIFYGEILAIATPLIASAVLLYFNKPGYQILIIFSIIQAIVLLILSLNLKETLKIKLKDKSVLSIIEENFKTAKESVKFAFSSSKIKTLMIYKSLGFHVAYLPLILLPVLSNKGMEDWFSGIIIFLASLGLMFSAKFAHKISDTKGYAFTWIFTSVIQAILLIVIGLVFEYWIVVAILYIIFNAFDGLWQPAWNHLVIDAINGRHIATVRSIIFSALALYTTFAKQFLAFFPINYALIGLGIFIIIVNIIMKKRVYALEVHNK